MFDGFERVRDSNISRVPYTPNRTPRHLKSALVPLYTVAEVGQGKTNRFQRMQAGVKKKRCETNSVIKIKESIKTF